MGRKPLGEKALAKAEKWRRLCQKLYPAKKAMFSKEDEERKKRQKVEKRFG